MTGVADAETGGTAAQALPAAQELQGLEDCLRPSQAAGISGRRTMAAARAAMAVTSTSCHVPSMIPIVLAIRGDGGGPSRVRLHQAAIRCRASVDPGT